MSIWTQLLGSASSILPILLKLCPVAADLQRATLTLAHHNMNLLSYLCFLFLL